MLGPQRAPARAGALSFSESPARIRLLAGPSRSTRGPDDLVGLPPDYGHAVEAVDIAQRTFKELGGPEWKIDLRGVLDVQDDRDARGCHVVFSLGRGSCGTVAPPPGEGGSMHQVPGWPHSQ